MRERLSDARVFELMCHTWPIAERDLLSTVVTHREGWLLAREVRDLREANGRMRGQIAEASAIVRNGTDYDRLHLSAILDAGLAPPALGGEG